jgi:hypothetical protein
MVKNVISGEKRMVGERKTFYFLIYIREKLFSKKI